MTPNDAKKVLAILKAAYPNSYKGMSREEAVGTVNVWAAQFAEYPVEVVMLAVQKLISGNVFPPSISEVKTKMQGLYWEATQRLIEHKQFNNLSTERVQQLQAIKKAVEPMQSQEKIEPSLTSLLSAYSGHLAIGSSDNMKLKERN